MRSTSGAEALSLDEAARSYFLEIAHIDSNYPSAAIQISPKDVLLHRDGLTDEEADEVIAVARRLNTAAGKEAHRAKGAASYQKLCADLRSAKTAEEKAKLFEESKAQSAADNRAMGASLLAQLKPSTRSRLAVVLEQHRNATTVVRRDWTGANLQEIDRYQASVCGSGI